MERRCRSTDSADAALRRFGAAVADRRPAAPDFAPDRVLRDFDAVPAVLRPERAEPLRLAVLFAAPLPERVAPERAVDPVDRPLVAPVRAELLDVVLREDEPPDVEDLDVEDLDADARVPVLAFEAIPTD
ncbi:hypothetical protein [Gordonia paraffinivorans]|uniref:hypothetical protein n=1 Tax=Gordonia paraffinivorans TaxID=175628 RepID=UPI000349483D|nr:hypothetical protein [Gordonia paraffinivorans]